MTERAGARYAGGTPALPARSRRVIVVTVAFIGIAVLLFSRGLALLIANMQHPAIAIFINSVEPAAARRIVIKVVVVAGVIRENPTRAETIANQRTRIFLFAGRDSIVELREFRALIQQI